MVSSPAAEEMPSYELRFWSGANVEQDSRFMGLSAHPCGQVAIAKVMSMPPWKKDQPLQPERVVEFSDKGDVLNEWSMPVDYYPIGIQENQLLVEAGEAQQLSIDLQGHITPVQDQPAELDPQSVDCVNLKREFPNSAYARCAQFPDRTHNRWRILGFESPCT